MDTDLIKQYQGFLNRIEEPIREIVPAIWDLPFIVDTGETCSGHALAQRGSGYEKYSERYSWYPHRATLDFAFSLDPVLTEARDEFRRDLKTACAEQKGQKIAFDEVATYNWDYLPGSRILHPNLREVFNASVPKLEKVESSVILIEEMLASFWEQVADVIRKYNKGAKIGPIKGKNFRGVINVVNWSRE